MNKGWPHKNLVAWQEAMELCRQVYLFTSTLPAEEKFNICSQLKRAAVSVPLNIAEGAARQSDKEFKQFLYTALGSLSEVNTILDLCVLLQFCDANTIIHLNEREQKCAALINGLIRSLNKKIVGTPS